MIVLTEAAIAEFWDSMNLEPFEPSPEVLREMADHYCRVPARGADEPRPTMPRHSSMAVERVQEN